MRGLIVSLALISVPFVAAVAQNPPQSERCKHTEFTKHDRDARDHDRKEDGQRSHDRDADDRCTPAPPPPPACGPTGALGGANSITGQVISATTSAGLPGWCIQALVNGTSVLGTVTDSSGNYTLAGLVGDTTTYLVCEVQQAGSTQTFPAGVPLPACPSGPLGYSFQLNTGNAASVDFWDSTP